MERINSSKLQILEQEADRAIEAAAKIATEMEHEATKVAENIRNISMAAAELSDLVLSTASQKK